MSTIRVATDYLKDEERKAVVLNAEFQSFSTLPGCTLSSSPSVERAFADFSGRWDDRRGELSKALQAIADGLGVIRTSFERCDAEMAGKLES